MLPDLSPIFNEIQSIQKQLDYGDLAPNILAAYRSKLEEFRSIHCEKLQQNKIICTPNDILKYRSGSMTSVSFESALTWPIKTKEDIYAWPRRMNVWRPYRTLTIIETGTFVQYFDGGEWLPYNRNSRIGNNEDFAQQFACPYGIVHPQTTYRSNDVYSSSTILRPAKVFFYVIGVDQNGDLDGNAGTIMERDFLRTPNYPYDRIESLEVEAFPLKHFQDDTHFFSIDWREGEDWIHSRFAKAANVSERDLKISWDDAKECMTIELEGKPQPIKQASYSSQHSMLLLLQKTYRKQLSIRFLNHIALGDDTAYFAVETIDKWRTLEESNSLIRHFFTPIELLPDIFNSGAEAIVEAGRKYQAMHGSTI
jgi:hypothetical protein